ncbi:unnamed protein product [Vitrella brassicaformis CCMP3155]|uniref:Uncharacterized protein n=1 Tax=Vitrella brassicaformis (strain CCMP3155) TaxID=1169540 RepID=A0A0G4FPV1_VITBC|nr:unnamed protein product [Vitrella brassicaformis CCMP3155]|eukprot:CEM16493.1 unnamed protein product [Vitrella brassicaformis CCMP3155]
MVVSSLTPNGGIQHEYGFAAKVDYWGRLQMEQRQRDSERGQDLKDSNSAPSSSRKSDPSPQPMAAEEAGAADELRQRPGRRRSADKNEQEQGGRQPAGGGGRAGAL